MLNKSRAEIVLFSSCLLVILSLIVVTGRYMVLASSMGVRGLVIFGSIACIINMGYWCIVALEFFEIIKNDV